jgi:hypothetical protein
MTMHRIALALLFLVGAVTGLWAYFAPHAWYVTFPGFGHSWLPQLGPYNEHLAADVGAMFLAFAVLSLIAFLRVRDVHVVRAAGLTWLVFNALHLVYHLRMLGMYRPVDQVLNVVTLVILLVLPLIVLFPAKRRRPAPRYEPVRDSTDSAGLGKALKRIATSRSSGVDRWRRL